MIRRPPRSTLFPYNDALPISSGVMGSAVSWQVSARPPAGSPPCVKVVVRALGTLRSEEHTSELQSLAYLVCRLLLEKKKIIIYCSPGSLSLHSPELSFS